MNPGAAADPRDGRRFSLVVCGVVLVASLATIGGYVWRMESTTDLLRALPIDVEAAGHLSVEIVGRRVEGHHGPGDSGFFDLRLTLEVSMPGGRGPQNVLVGALLSGGDEALNAFGPIACREMKPGERRRVELDCTPIPRPMAERATRLVIRAR